jgi:hypothetical protein
MTFFTEANERNKELQKKYSGCRPLFAGKVSLRYLRYLLFKAFFGSSTEANEGNKELQKCG